MSTVTQANRQLQITTPLGPDKLLITSFSGHEGLSELFHFDLSLISLDDAIDPNAIVGQGVTFSVVDDVDSPRRFFHGIVRAFRGGSRESGFREYRAEVVPWLWFLTRTADCRVFQRKNAKEIIEEIFTGLGFTDFEMDQIQGTPPQREYCVQYNESAFNFVSRIMEEEGIFYFFRHEDGNHTMVLANHAGVHQDCPDNQLEHEFTFTGSQRVPRLLSWNHAYEFISGKWAQTDYDFEKHPSRNAATPAKILLTNSNSVVGLPGIDRFEQFEYPGRYLTKEAGNPLTKGRMEEEERRFDTVTASSLVPSLFCGGKFTVKKHPIAAEQGKSWVISKIDHSATEPGSFSGAPTGGAGTTYSNQLVVIPADVTFRPLRVTPKPRIFGSQTAVVIGPSNEEIWPDKYGRVLVEFFWDRYGKRDEKTSCFVRVSQSSAGKGWGTMFLPRIGQEVVVTYLDGDPDRPLITGVVYNAEQMPAYTLPKEKNKSYIKTNSTMGGDGFNELRFDDTKDKEQVFVHAERNMDVRVKANNMNTIGGSRFTTVGYEKDGEAKGDDQSYVHGKRIDNVKSGYQIASESDMFVNVGNSEREASLATAVNGFYVLDVKKDMQNVIGVNRGTQIEGSDFLTINGSRHDTVNQEWKSFAGNTFYVKSGGTIVLEAMTQLTLKVQGNFIDINPTGIFIQGTMVNINTGGAPGQGVAPDPADLTSADLIGPPQPPMQADNSKTGKKSAPDSLE